MYECPNCTHEQLHQIYTCMQCGHVVKEYDRFGGWQPQCEEEEPVEPPPYQICGEPGCDANTEGNRPYCDKHTDIDGAQMAHNEMEND